MSARVFETVRVAAASKAYDVAVGRGLLDEVGERIRGVLPDADDAVLLVCDSNTDALYSQAVGSSLAAAGYKVDRAVVQAGERSKNLDAYRALLEEAARFGLTRTSTVVALGGGVVGDLAGFAAATYMRGCHLVQLATSLLAMVDSSVGGKTAVDLPQGKNLAGAFYQPDLVLCDLDCLGTLPPTYLADGMGEIAKYAVMADPELFGWLGRPLAGQEERVVARCIAHQARRRGGRRARGRRAQASEPGAHGGPRHRAPERLRGFRTATPWLRGRPSWRAPAPRVAGAPPRTPGASRPCCAPQAAHLLGSATPPSSPRRHANDKKRSGDAIDVGGGARHRVV